MCFQATCGKCSKKSWRGCGQHISSVMDHVPKDQWCTCEPRVKFRGTEYPPSPPLEIPGLSWLSGLFGGGGQKADAKKDGAGKEEL